jgi:YfiH family protein
VIRSNLLAALPGIAHGFFTRDGGVSSGLYATLNVGLGSQDARDAVIENRARVARALGVADHALAMPYQVHSPDVVVVEEPWPHGEGPHADAVVTARPGLAVGVATADCGPILFADAKGHAVGAAHAGWKGAFGGVIEATVAAMERLGAARGDIVAVLGPTISAEAYEVGPEFVERFIADDPDHGRFFRPSSTPGHAMFEIGRTHV